MQHEKSHHHHRPTKPTTSIRSVGMWVMRRRLCKLPWITLMLFILVFAYDYYSNKCVEDAARECDARSSVNDVKILLFDATPSSYSASEAPPLDGITETVVENITSYRATVGYHVTSVRIVVENLPENVPVICQYRRTKPQQLNWPLMQPPCTLFQLMPFNTERPIDIRIIDQCSRRILKQFRVTLVKLSLEQSSLPAQNHSVVCTLSNDCYVGGAAHAKNRPCGLQPSKVLSWSKFLENFQTLPVCHTHVDASPPRGQWVVPCSANCSSDYAQCHWLAAKWLMLAAKGSACRLRTLNDSVPNCLRNVSVAFVGDSTLHLPMRALMSQLPLRRRSVPLTLTAAASDILDAYDNFARPCLDCRYSHDYDVLVKKIYFNPDNSPCALGKLPHTGKRKMPRHCMFEGAFDSALDWLESQRYQAPNRRLLLVLGGADWLLSMPYFLYVNQTLHEYGLNRTLLPVVLRGHVASYFSYDTSVRRQYAFGEILEKRAENYEMLRFASGKLGFSAVDAWHMTVLRWKEWYEAQCQCHHYSTPPEEWQKFRESDREWLERNNILQAEAETLMHGICDALHIAKEREFLIKL